MGKRFRTLASLVLLSGFLPASSLTTGRAGAAGPVPVLAAAGDIACDPGDGSFKAGAGTATACRQKATSDLLVAGRFDAVLPLGDTQYNDGAYTKYFQSYDKSWGRMKSTSFPAVGNHEYMTKNAAGYYNYFGTRAGPWGKGYYSYDLGTWHLIALNSECWTVGGCGAGSVQEKWLKGDLAAHKNLCTLAYWHEPRFSSGEHGSNTALTTFWQDLYNAGADVVLSGHDHDYERFAPQDASGKLDPVRGIREFVVGTGGKSHYAFKSIKPNSEVRDASTFGILSLTLLPTGYSWRFLPEAGKTFTDAGFGFCH